MFKRKEARPVGVGDLCAIDINIVDRIKGLDAYKLKSTSRFANNTGHLISERMFRNFDKTLMFADVRLFYIKKKSIFDGLLEVVPLFYDDNRNGTLARNSMNRNKTMLVHSSSLTQVSGNYVQNVRYTHSPDLGNRLLSGLEINHGVKNFSWDGS
tara:strand:+ start:769 stop:1233 length:465 start_codon:yes stop_codon:yes gene_type:complete